MAYSQSKTPDSRVIIAVALVQGAAIYGLLSGLAVDFTNEVFTPFEARNIPDAPPPPDEIVPEPKPQETPKSPEMTAPAPVLDIPRPDKPMELPRLIEPELPVVTDLPVPGNSITIVDFPKPEPKPALAPVKASPRGDPTRWIGTSDYPTRDLREGNEGTVRFSLEIDARGNVSSCRIERSSGHPGLDAATCKLVSRRARFKPGKDGSGAAVPGSYSQTVRWVIPQ